MKYLKSSVAAVSVVLLGTAAVFAAPGQGRMKADADGNGVITKQEAMQAAEARFAKMDANADGLLNKDDREARSKQRFAKMDANGDGSVTEEEFMAAREARQAKRAERRAKGEGKRRGGKMGKRGRKMAMLLKKADSNQDGALSKSEFLAHAEARFARADADNNGEVTKEERRAARKKMREERKRARAG